MVPGLRGSRFLAAGAIVALLVPGSLGAQGPGASCSGTADARGASSPAGSGAGRRASLGGVAPGTPLACRSRGFPMPSRSRDPQRPGAGRAFLSSIVLPGAGQWQQGQGRAWAYAGVEAVAWVVYVERRRAGDVLRDRYRDLAWQTARVRDAGARVDGDFSYYEALGQYGASGAWDADPEAQGIQPETDPSTFNGRIWELARRLHARGPEDPDPGSEAYRRALEYYRQRGVPPELAWDWSGNQESRSRYRSLIDESDDRFRQATLAVGAVLGNHVLSAADAFLSARLGDPEARSHSLTLRSWTGPTGRYRMGLLLRIPH